MGRRSNANKRVRDALKENEMTIEDFGNWILKASKTTAYRTIRVEQDEATQNEWIRKIGNFARERKARLKNEKARKIF